MTLRTILGKLRLKIFRLLLGRDLFMQATSGSNKIDLLRDETNKARQDISAFALSAADKFDSLERSIAALSASLDYLKYQADMSLRLSNKIQTFLLTKEQSPELLKGFASGLCNDRGLIDSLVKTNIFSELQSDFRHNINVFMEKFHCGALGLDLKNLYENQISLAKNPLYRQQVFNNILAVFMPQYKNDEIACKLDELYDKSFVMKDKWGSIQYLSWLLLRNEEEKALDILKYYLKFNELETIQEYIPIADLAHRNGMTNDMIATSSGLFQIIVKNVNGRMLESYIESFGKDVTIAIVGSGPHELGLGKGEEIDAHDIVVRFNNYNTDEKYIKDYGKKTSIIFFTSSGANFDHREFFKLLDKPADLFVTHSLYTEQFATDMIHKYKEKPFSNITTIELSAARYEIQRKYCINWPTTGFRAVYYLKEILRKNIKKSDIYGFALNHGLVIGGYYDNPSFADSSIFHHDLSMEYDVMKDIFKE